MNIRGNLRKITEFGIGMIAVVTLALAGCGGGGSTGSTAPVGAAMSGVVTTIAGAAGSCGYTNNVGTLARFCAPDSIATDGTNLYVGENGTHAIRKIVIATGAVSTFAGSLTGASGVSDGTGTSALFGLPAGIVSDGTSLYVADYGNNNIRKIDIATQQVTTIAGSVTGASGVTNATGTNALFNHPVGLSKIGNNLYVADYSSHVIRKVDLTTNPVTVTTFAGTGLPGYNLGTSPASSTLFDYPSEITSDGSSLFVADSGNNDIRKIDIASLSVSTLAGGYFVSSGVVDATGTAARFNTPFGVSTDGNNLYVADTFNNTIRKVVINTGVVTTLAGMAGASGVTDATGTSARFNKPYSSVYINGTLYVVDFGNHCIRKIQL